MIGTVFGLSKQSSDYVSDVVFYFTSDFDLLPFDHYKTKRGEHPCNKPRSVPQDPVLDPESQIRSEARSLTICQG
jgi:hypothetical protein